MSRSRVWLITGSASGLGAGIARAALNNGDQVVATDLDLARLDQTYRDDQVLTATLDIRDERQAHAVVEAAMARFGRIDVLVNNAGYGQFGPFEEVEPDAIERQFATNVFGTFNVTRAVLPVMRRQRSGHLIMMSSNGGFKGVRGASMYSASKFAIEGFSEALAEEVSEFGIHLTLLEPGAFRTDFLDSRMLKLGTRALSDYDAFRTHALAVFEARHHQQIGDPDRLGQAVIELAGLPEPPLRFIAGSDAVNIVEAKLVRVGTELERWRSLSLSTDFPH